VIPQISAIMGPCAGGAVYSPAITDFIVMVRDTSYMFVTGPDVVKTVTHESVTKEQLGGATTHNETSGVAHFAVGNDRECLALIRTLLSYLPGNNIDDPPIGDLADPVDRESPELDSLVPSQPNQPYDMHDLVTVVADEGSFLECTPTTPATSSWASRDWAAAAPASSPINRHTWLARSTSTRRSKQRGSCGSATPSTSRW
jgi:propionyl-CoA carboxylase beta chain